MYFAMIFLRSRQSEWGVCAVVNRLGQGLGPSTGEKGKNLAVDLSSLTTDDNLWRMQNIINL